MDYEDIEWIHLVQYRGKWGAVLNTVVHLRVPKIAGNFLTS